MSSHWGPGWFFDVFDVKISFDNNPPQLSDTGPGGEGEVFTDPWYAHDGSMSLFCGSDAAISGTVALTTRNKRKVHHLGIKVTIEEYIHFMDPYVPTRLKCVHDTIVQDDVVEGEAMYPFRIPLSLLSSAAAQDSTSRVRDKGVYVNVTHWLNSYIGNSFAIRHVLLVEVYRPWYTFNLLRYKILCFQKMDTIFLSNSPQQQHIMEKDKNLPQESVCHGDIVPEIFHVDGLAGSGKCRVALVSTRINLARSPLGYSRGGAAGDGAIIRGTLQLLDLEETIVSAKFMLLRAEFIGAKSTHDALECEHLIFGVEEADKVDLLEDEVDRHLRLPLSRGYLSRQDVEDHVVDTPRFTDPVRLGTSIQFEICLDGSGRNNDMNETHSSAPPPNKDNSTITHQMRIQNALWQNLATQLNPTFYYVPLDLTEEIEEEGDVDLKEETEVSPASSAVPVSVLKVPETRPLSASSTTKNTNIGHDATSSQGAEIFPVTSDESVCLRYFLRLVLVEKSGTKLWETIELSFHYSPHHEQKSNSFLSARSLRSSMSAVVVPPYLSLLEKDQLTEKNENV